MKLILSFFLVLGLQSLIAQTNCHLAFNGDWEMKRYFEVTKGFSKFADYEPNYKHTKFSDGFIELTIASSLNGNPDPSKEQLATYKYICENQDFISTLLLDSSLVYFADYIEEFFDNTEFEKEEGKSSLEPSDLKLLMLPTRIHILDEHKDGFAYYGIGGHSAWELDEGFGFLLHKKRVIAADVIFVASENEPALRDLGTYEAVKAHEKALKQGEIKSPKPKLYTPHPKYGKLKPIERCKNVSYVRDLLAQGYTEDIIAMHQEGIIEIQTSKSLHYNYLKQAVLANNLDLVRYFLSHNNLNVEGLVHIAAGHENIEMMLMLLDYGADINEIRLKGTALDFASKTSDEFKQWLFSKGALTKEEIVFDYIENDKHEELDYLLERSLISTNTYSVLGMGQYLKKALVLGKKETAISLFSHLRGTDGFLMQKACNLNSKDLVEYLINKNIDINSRFRNRNALDVLQKKKQHFKDEELIELNAFYDWMVQNGAKLTK